MTDYASTTRPEAALFYRNPRRSYPVVDRGEGIYLWDTTGKRYIDACGGALVASIGYGVPEIVEAMTAQLRRTAFAHGSQFTSEVAEQLAQHVAALTPGDLNRVYFLSGGSEATETTVKLARQFHVEAGRPGKYKVISRWGSYHGATLGALSLSGIAARRKLYEPLLLPVHHVGPSYCYRCPWGKTYPDCDLFCADEVERAIEEAGPDTVSAFIAEPIVGAALGAVVPPAGYFEKIRAICDRHDVLWIADEVMTCLGRTGRNFGVQHWHALPDMIAMAKGLSSGYAPMGAVAVREHIHDTIRGGSGTFVHGHTYGQHVGACAAALAVVRYIETHGLIARAERMGRYFFEKLAALRVHPCVGDIRGRGLMIGIEFVADRATRAPVAPAAQFAQRLSDLAFERGLIVYPGRGSVDGTAGDHILLGPHYITTEAEADEIVGLLEQCIGEVERQTPA